MEPDNTKDSIWSFGAQKTTAVHTKQKRDYAVSAGNTCAFDGELDLDGLVSNRISSTIGNKQDFDSGIAQNTWVIIGVIFNKTGNQIGVRVDGDNAFTPVKTMTITYKTSTMLRIFPTEYSPNEWAVECLNL